MKVQELLKEATLKLGARDDEKAKAWIQKMKDTYQASPLDSRQRVMVWGSGDDQELAFFELELSSTPGAVDVKWFQAYPLRSGVGTKAMKELQAHAKKDGITLTLYPWDRGRISQAALTKFYKKQGFKPKNKGGKDMIWVPDLTEAGA